MTQPQPPAPQPLPLTYVSPAGDAPLAPTAENAHLLQHAAVYYGSTRLLRSSGGWDLIWGSMAVLAGTAAYLLPVGLPPQLRIFPPVLMLIGAALLGTSVWLIVAPSPLAMIADGLSLILLALMDLAWWIASALHPSPPPRTPGWYWLVLFAISLLAGIGRFRRYKRFKTAAQSPPSKATLRWLNEMRRHLKRATVRTTPMFIRFEASGVPPVGARAQLLPDLAVCLINRTRLAFIAEPELVIQPIAPIVPGKKGKAQIQMPGRQLNGMIDAASYARYVAWKDAQETEIEIEEENTTG